MIIKIVEFSKKNSEEKKKCKNDIENFLKSNEEVFISNTQQDVDLTKFNSICEKLDLLLDMINKVSCSKNPIYTKEVIKTSPNIISEIKKLIS